MFDPLPTDAKPVKWALAAAVLLAVPLDAVLFRLLFAHPGNDQAWLLYAARAMLGGTPLYGPQLVETNPPLILWLSAVPVQLALWLHADPVLLLRLLTSLLAGFCAAVCVSILRRAGLLATPFATAFAALVMLAATLNQHGNDFGQKEHLLVLLLLPYLLAATLPEASLRLPARLTLAGFAALGLCLKPQNALVLVALEVFLLVATKCSLRWLRAENLVIVLTGGLYILAVWLFTPLYLRDTLPLLRATYWAFGEASTAFILRDHPLVTLLLALAALAAFLLRKRLRFPLAAPALLAAALGAFLAFALQHKNWPYQLFPMETLLVAAVLLLVLENFPPIRRPRLLFAATLVLAALPLPALVRFGRAHNRAVQQTPDSPYLDHVLLGLPAGTRVAVLTTRLAGFSDVLDGRLVWASRYAHLWMLPALVLNERALAPPEHTLPPERVAALSDQLRSDLADDLRLRQPQVVVVVRCPDTGAEPCQGLPHIPFELLPWLLRSPAFAAEWARYRRSSGDLFLDVYQRLD